MSFKNSVYSIPAVKIFVFLDLAKTISFPDRHYLPSPLKIRNDPGKDVTGLSLYEEITLLS